MLACLLLPLACTADPSTPPPGVTWTARQAPLPSASLLVPLGDRLLVAGQRDDRSPALAPAADSKAAVPVRPVTFYGRLTAWHGVALSGGRLFAYGGARGGAHGNMRWTVWQGSAAAGLDEDEQTFETFGGWGAGGLVGIAVHEGAPLLVGSWRSEGPGLDIAVWQLHGHTWTRRPSTGSVLAGTAREQVSARGLDQAGDGLAISGAVTLLRDGTVRMRPALWVSGAGSLTWRRLLLPAAGVVAEAHRAACDSRRCMVTGVVDGRVAVWSVDLVRGDAAAEPVPSIRIPEGAVALRAATVRGRTVIVVPGVDTSPVLVRDGDGWSRRNGPTGQAVDLAVADGRLTVLTTGRDGVPRLSSAAAVR